MAELRKAAQFGNLETVKDSICKGEKVDSKDEYGLTALMLAASNGYIDIAGELLSAGATVDLVDNNGLTALMYAANGGHTDLVQLLTSSGATIDLANQYGLTALMYAASEGHKDAVQLLTLSRATVDLADNVGWTALMYAARYGHTDTARHLLASGAKPDLVDNNGFNALMYAARDGRTDTTKQLLASGAKLDMANKYGQTALMLAARRGHTDTTRELLASGATPDLANNDGETALMIAREAEKLGYSNTETISVLLEADKYSQVHVPGGQEKDDQPPTRPSASTCNYSKQLQKLMVAKSTIVLRYLKMFFVGPPNVGKTITRLRLCHELKNILSRGGRPLPDSTLLANCKQVLMCISSEEGGNQWVSSSGLEEEARILFTYMCMADQAPIASSQRESQPNLADQASTASSQDESQGVAEIQPGSMSASSEGTSKPHSKIDEVMSRFQAMIQSGDYSKFLDYVESSLLVNLHDIGGQPGFLEMLPSLISGPAAYLVFFNLAQLLDVPYKIPFRKDGTVITPYDAEHTTEDLISQILTAVASINYLSQQTSFELPDLPEPLQKFVNQSPVASLVGTHMDLLEGQAESVESQLDKKHAALKKVTDSFSQIVVNPGSGKAFLALDNHKGTEESDLCPLREHIMKLIKGELGAELPINPVWLMLSIILHKEYNIVSLEDCIEIGRRLKMDEEDVKLALWYLHRIVGTLMYHPELADEDKWFEENIFCSPQIIFDSISQFIVASLRLLHSDGAGVRECFRKDWIEKGLFSLKAIHDSLKSVPSDHEQLIPADKLVTLLEHVNLLSPVTPDPQSLASMQYFMPTMLDCASTEELAHPPKPDDNNPAPILVKFKYGFVPTGVFCGLVTRLVSQGPSKILGMTWELKKDYVRRNRVCFYVDKVHVVTLISHARCYEIRVERRKSFSLFELCSQVLSTILVVLNELHSMLEPILAFACPCDKHPKGSRDLTNMCEVTDVATCMSEHGERAEVKLRNEHKFWTGKHAEIGSKVNLKLMKSYPEDFSFEWSTEDDDVDFENPKPNALKVNPVTEDHYGVYRCEVKKKGKLVFTAYRSLYIPGLCIRHPAPEIGVLTLARLRGKIAVTDSQLDKDINGHEYKLGGCFDTADSCYLDKLGLSAAQQSDVSDLKFREGVQKAMEKALKLWLHRNPFSATFRNLLEIVLDLQMGLIAKHICEYIKDNVK